MPGEARLAMHERLQNFIHHAQMIVSVVLVFYIHEILVQGIYSGRQQPGDVQTRLG